VKNAFSLSARYTLILLLTALLVSGCSNSSSGRSDSQSPAETDVLITDVDTDNSASTTTNRTVVDFDITVPVYISNALQVRLVWGDKDITANWVSEQSWVISEEFPTNTENPLVVTFNDDNGAITLGSFETDFKTGSNASEKYQITADQFDTNRWDSDGDGVSNLNELIAGTNPHGGNAPETAQEPQQVQAPTRVQASLELVPDKTFRISWQPSTDAEFYRVLENPDGVSGFTQISEDLEPSTHSIDHRVALYARVNASYIVQACNSSGCVDSDEQMVIGRLESAIGYIKASAQINSDRKGYLYFGAALDLSADGNTLAITAIGEDSGTVVNGTVNYNSPETPGTVYVFVLSDGNWQQQARLKGSNAEGADRFGSVVSLSADGDTLAIGSMWEGSAATGINGDQNDNSASRSGAVYLFARSNATDTTRGTSGTGEIWQQQAYVKASNTEGDDEFGAQVSLSADGNTLAVGARTEGSGATGVDGDQNNNFARYSGAVYVFARSNGNWQQQAYLKASNTDPADRFGAAISLSADSNTLAVGAYGEDSAATGINGNQNDNIVGGSGAVYVFTRGNSNEDASGTWQQQAYLKASNTNSGDVFGISVSLSADGDTLAVGARDESSAATGINGDQADNSRFTAGAVYVFERRNTLDGTSNINENWQQKAYLKASNTDSSDDFGIGISLSADGNTLAVSAEGEDSAATGINGNQTDNTAMAAGAVYVFTRGNTIDGIGGEWQQQAYVKASNTDELDLFGNADAISLSANGETLAVGAYGESSAASGINGNQDDNSKPDSGAVYLY